MTESKNDASESRRKSPERPWRQQVDGLTERAGRGWRAHVTARAARLEAAGDGLAKLDDAEFTELLLHELSTRTLDTDGKSECGPGLLIAVQTGLAALLGMGPAQVVASPKKQEVLDGAAAAAAQRRMIGDLEA